MNETLFGGAHSSGGAPSGDKKASTGMCRQGVLQSVIHKMFVVSGAGGGGGWGAFAGPGRAELVCLRVIIFVFCRDGAQATTAFILLPATYNGVGAVRLKHIVLPWPYTRRGDGPNTGFS